MQGRFDPASFSTEVMEVASRLVPATITLWSRVAARMLPTPAKFHYLFNMRELSKVAFEYPHSPCKVPHQATMEECWVAQHA